jgi:hypothetical protein
MCSISSWCGAAASTNVEDHSCMKGQLALLFGKKAIWVVRGGVSA